MSEPVNEHGELVRAVTVRSPGAPVPCRFVHVRVREFGDSDGADRIEIRTPTGQFLRSCLLSECDVEIEREAYPLPGQEEPAKPAEPPAHVPTDAADLPKSTDPIPSSAPAEDVSDEPPAD